MSRQPASARLASGARRIGAAAALLIAPSILWASGPVPSEWSQWRADRRGSGAIYLRLPDTPALEAWRFRAGSHVWGYQPGISVWSSAAAARVDGRALLFVGSYDHDLYCLDAISGRKVWSYTTGGGVYAAPTLWHGPKTTIVFAGASDRLVYALEAASGRRLWTYQVQSWRPTIGGARLSSAAVGRVGGRAAVFFGHWIWDKSLGGHLQAGGITAVDALSGARRWTRHLGDNRVSSPLFVELAAGPRVFVATEDGNLHALDAGDGRSLWRHTERNAIKASPVLFEDRAGPRLVIGSKHGFVRCLDARDGREVWRFKTGHWVDGSAAVARLEDKPVVFVGSYDTRIYALDGSSGEPLWSYRTAAGIYSSPALIEDRGRLQLLFASWDHHLYCLDAADGSLRWSAFIGRPLWDAVTLGDSIWSSPTAVSINGRAMVYFGSYAGPLHALPLAATARHALARPGTNLRFWITLPLVLLVVAALAIYLTRRERAAQNRPPT